MTATEQQPGLAASRLRRYAALAVVLLLLAAACGGETDDAGDADEDAETSDPGGDDGADEDTADEASALDPDNPIELKLHTIFGPEHPFSVPLTDYADAVEEASGGGITFERFYAGAVVPPAELGDAMSRGVIDIALQITAYTPADFPLSTWIADLAFLEETGPVVGTLQGAGAWMEWGLNDEYQTQFEEAGLKPLVPGLLGTKDFHLLCKDGPVTNLAEAEGKRVRAGGASYVAQAEALGMVPVQLAGDEVYEGLQRGIVDCVIGSVSDVEALGLMEIASHWTLDSEVAFVGFAGGLLSMGLDKWNSLPVEAQRILWDNLDVWLESQYRIVLGAQASAVTASREGGMNFYEFDEDIREVLTEWNEERVEAVKEGGAEVTPNAEALVDQLVELHEEWLPVVTDDLGYSDEGTWAAWAEANPDGDVDVQPWVDHVMAELFEPARP